MAGPLAAMERFFERIFERPAARLLAPRLEAVHLQRHLERAMESGRVRQGGKWHVKSRYRLLLHPSDLVALSGREALPAELGESLRDHARRRGYVLDSRPSVRLEVSPRVSAGDVVVLTDDPVERAGPSPADARGGEGQRLTAPAWQPSPDQSGQQLPATAQPRLDSHQPPEVQPQSVAEQQPGPSTSVYRAARPAAPRATLVIRAPGQPPARLPVDGATVRIGRASDNDVVLADRRVSRHHAQISVRLGTLIYTDLGSTNGSFLQGSRVQEIALGPHDVIQLGGSTLTIEPAAQ